MASWHNLNFKNFHQPHLFNLELLRALVEELLVHLHEQFQRVVYKAVDCLDKEFYVKNGAK